MAIGRYLERTARNDELCKKFKEIPGVEPVTSLAFKSTIDNPRCFGSNKELASHLGLTPRLYQSGEIDRTGCISKCGDAMLRKYLYEPAHCHLSRCRQWTSIRSWGMRIAKELGMKRASVAVARKLSIVMSRMWITGDHFQFGKCNSDHGIQDSVRDSIPLFVESVRRQPI